MPHGSTLLARIAGKVRRRIDEIPRRGRTLVALVGHTRVGTHYLKSLLGTHPSVHFHDEVLYPNAEDPYFFYHHWAMCVREDPAAILVGQRVPELFEEYLWHMAEQREEPVVGFDLKIPQLEELPALHGVVHRHARVLHLVRRNTLRAVLSELAMWHRLRQGDTEVHRGYQPPPVRLRVDPDHVLAEAERRVELDEAIHHRYHDLGDTYLRLDYESLATSDDPSDALGPVMRFLGVDPSRATYQSDLVRQNPGPLAEMVRNADQLRQRLEGTAFSEQLDD